MMGRQPPIVGWRRGGNLSSAEATRVLEGGYRTARRPVFIEDRE